MNNQDYKYGKSILESTLENSQLYFNIQEQLIEKTSVIIGELLSKNKKSISNVIIEPFNWEDTEAQISYKDFNEYY